MVKAATKMGRDIPIVSANLEQHIKTHHDFHDALGSLLQDPGVS